MTPRLTDLRLATGLLVGAVGALLVPGVPWPVEWAVGLPLLVVVPGYGVVAALFPTTPDGSSGSVDLDGEPGWPARLALSLAVSAVVVAVIGVFLAAVGSLTLGPVVLLVTGVSLVGLGVAAGRRRKLTNRVGPAVELTPDAATNGTTGSRTQTVVLGVAVVALLGALAVAGGTAASDEPYSEAYLSVAEGDGTLRPANGSVTLVSETDNVVSLTIGNHEGVETEYGVVVLLQRVETDGTVSDQQRLDRFDTGLDANETESHERRLSPSMTGDRLRLRTLVYKGGVPESANVAEADLSLRHWVTVTTEGSA